jgi:hypothetical protein
VVAAYLANLYGAWQNCHGNLATVADTVHKQQAAVK